MGTAIILVILTVIIIFAIKGSVKHTKGQGGCCGGSGEIKVKKKHLKQVVDTKVIFVEGMTCDNCRRRIENRLNSIEQVNVKVKLKEKKVLVKLGQTVSDELLISAIESMGYKVTSIKGEEYVS